MNQITIITKALAQTITERKEVAMKEKALKDELIKQLHESNKDKEETPDGIFTIARRPKYTYSAKLQKQQEKLKIAQVDEVEQGKAKVEMSEYILFKEITM